jgi:phosphoserine phosphatase
MSKCTWPAFDLIFFDCDSTLSTIEGIDELAKSRGLFDEVQRLTNAAMDGEVHLESVYDRRLQLLRPTRGEIRQIERLYRENLVPDARQIIEALSFLDKTIFIVSGGLYPAVRPFGEWLGVPATHIRAVKVAYDTLSGEWWDYQRDQWGQRPDVNYLAHHADPLVQSTGKAEVVRELRGDRPGRSMLIGDGMSDLAAKAEVDKLIGFGGVVTRAGVVLGADIFIACPTLAPILPLVTSYQDQHHLRHTQFAPLLQKGLDLIKQNAITFKNEAWRQAILAASG